MTTALTKLLGQKVSRNMVRVGLDDEMVFLIGDVHGCYEEFVELCDKCRKYAKENMKFAKIVQLGDLIDRGPYFFKIFEYIKRRNDVMFINGNHEYNFFVEQTAKRSCRSKARMETHGKFSFLTDEQKDLVLGMIANAPLGVYGNTKYAGSFMATHAPPNGIEYFVRPSGKHVNLVRGAFTSFSRANSPDLEYLAKKWGGIDSSNHTVYHGHQQWDYKNIKDQLKEQDKASVSIINLDSGCVYGDSLTAICVDTKKAFSVNAKKVYQPK